VSTRHVICVSKGASTWRHVNQSVSAHRASYDYNVCVCIRQIKSYSSTGYSTSTRRVICVSKGNSTCKCVSQSVSAHRGHTIIMRVFAYGKSQVKVSSQTETQQAACKVTQREPSMQDAYFSCVRVRI